MKIELVDIEMDGVLLNDFKELEEMYCFYKKACEDLKLIIENNLDLDSFFRIIMKYYDVELFESENDTYMTCNLLGIKPKRLSTDFILYEKDKHAPKFYFEDWIIMETGKVDARRIYSQGEIDNLLDDDQMVVLYPYAKRPASKRLQHVPNDNSSYDLTYNGKFVIDESELGQTSGQLENITYYNDWMRTEFNLYNSPIIQSKLKEKVFTKERLMKDVASYRFRALEVLKLIKNLATKKNLNISGIIEEEINMLRLKKN